MVRRRVSVTTVVAATLVAVTTVLLTVYGMTSYIVERNREWSRLRRVTAAQADELAVALAAPVWNIDRGQIEKILDSQTGVPSIEAVIVEAAGRSHARVRDSQRRFVNDTGILLTTGLLSAERPITFNGERVGTVRLFTTPRFIEAQMRQSLLTIVGTILAIDLLLIISVYVVLWRTVLRPLKEIERYAGAVTAGGDVQSLAPRNTFTLEVENLRSSIATMIELLGQRYSQLQQEVVRRFESEERFRTIFDSVNDAIFIHHADTAKILDVNDRACEMYGYTRQELMSAAAGSLSSGRDGFTSEDVVARIRAARDRGPQLFEWEAKRKDGSLFRAEVSMRAATIGGARRVIVVLRDITHRREMEQALREEKEFTDAAIDSIMGTFFVLDRQGRYVRWNKPMQDLLALSNAEMFGRDGLLVIHHDDRPLVVNSVAKAFESGRAEVEARIVMPDGGEVRDYILVGTRMDRGGESFLVGTGIDVTDRNRLRRAIEESAAEWHLTFDSVRTAIVIIDRDGRIRRGNRAAADLAEADVAGRTLDSFDVEPWRTAAELMSEKNATQRETRDAYGRSWDVMIDRLSLSPGDASFIAGFRDITRVVALQESLRRSETMSAMGALVAGVAHEVRNPLFGISAMLDAYGDELRQAQLDEFSDGLRSQVTRLTQLMRDLLEFGRPVATQLSDDAMTGLLDEVIVSRARAARDASVDLRSEVDPALSLVPMDRGRMRQVFENLVDNALQQAPAARTITVAAKNVTDGGRAWVECRVEDDGRGFQENDIARVFEPFFTRRDRGTGLGLSIVQRIVQEHAGTVTAGNRTSGGAVLTVRLPAVQGIIDPLGHAPEQDPPRR